MICSERLRFWHASADYFVLVFCGCQSGAGRGAANEPAVDNVKSWRLQLGPARRARENAHSELALQQRQWHRDAAGAAAAAVALASECSDDVRSLSAHELSGSDSDD